MISLVTGAAGFIGSHLVDYLLARGDTVVALQRKPAVGGDRLRVVEADVLDAERLTRVMCEHVPDEIYHLAAQSLPNVSWEHPQLTHRINVEGTLNVMEAARAGKIAPAIVVASSSAIYAQRDDDTAIREDDYCRPGSPYGTSKLAADHLARLYAERYGMRVLRARPFFLVGTRKVGDVSSDWARNVVAIERGISQELAVGNLDIVRDFLHVADGVEGLATMAAKGRAGEAYNVCSGRGCNLKEVLAALRGMARTNVDVRLDRSKVRPIDERVKIGESAKLRSLGWSERRSVAEALREMLDYWRARE